MNAMFWAGAATTALYLTGYTFTYFILVEVTHEHLTNLTRNPSRQVVATTRAMLTRPLLPCIIWPLTLIALFIDDIVKRHYNNRPQGPDPHRKP